LRDRVIPANGAAVALEPLPPERRAAVEQALARCTDASGATDPIYALLDVAIVSAPLCSEELEVMWQTLARWPCVTRLGAGRQWLELVRAVGRRDPEAIARLASAMLAGKAALTPAREKYLLATAMTGWIALGERGRAFALWQQRGPRLFAKESPKMLFRILAAQAASGAN
jgi:hypothetical protein